MSAFRASRVVVRVVNSFKRNRRRHLAMAPRVAEVLERRQLLTAGATVEAVLSGDALVIDGTNLDDEIRLHWLRNDASTNQLNVTAGGQFIESFAATGVQKIIARTYDGNDKFQNGTALPSVIYGGAGDDTLVGGSGDDQLFGDSGADVLQGRDGADLLKGGAGNDTLQGDAGNDRLSGQDDNDQLLGGAGEDTLFGDAGNDTLYGNDQNDRLYGGDGSDQMYGDGGDDLLIGHEGNDFLSGGNGNDTLQGDAGIDRLEGGNGNDRLVGGTETDRMFGGNGNDLLMGGVGEDSLFGDAGNDTLYGNDQNDRLYGGDGVDQIFGDGGDDLLFGHEGNDVLSGGNGDDTLYGEAGIDRLEGGNNNDRLFGGTETDRLYGGNGNDTLIGDDGDDWLYGEAGFDKLYGGPANDFLDGGTQNDQLFGQSGNDRLFGRLGDDQLDGGDGDDELRGHEGIDRIRGGEGNDFAFGDADDDRLYGDNGDDVLRGGLGADFISGGAGDDDIDGGGGFDVVFGGTGVNAIIGEKVDGNTLPFLPRFVDIDIPRGTSTGLIVLPSVDADGDPLVYDIASNVPEIQFDVQYGAQTTLNVLVPHSFVGTAEITVTADDGRGFTDSRTFFVSARNQSPQIVAVENVHRVQGTGGFRLPFNVTDGDGDVLERTALSDRADVSVVVVTGSGGQSEVLVTPSVGFVGLATITLQASDGIAALTSVEFTVEVIASVATQEITGTGADPQQIRLDTAGNVYAWRNSGDVNAALIAENTRSLTAGMDGKLFRLGLDGTVNRLDPDGTWTSYEVADPNIARLHAVNGYVWLIPNNGGTLGVISQSTTGINSAFLTGTVQNEIAGGNLYTLDSARNLWVNGVPHQGPPVFAGPNLLYYAAASRVMEVTVAHDTAYYLTVDGTVYRVLSQDPHASTRVPDYSQILRIRGLGNTVYLYSRYTGVSFFWHDGLIGGDGEDLGYRQGFASDQDSGYVLENSRLYRIPPGDDETRIFIRDDVSKLVGHAGRLYFLDNDGQLYRRDLIGTHELLGTGVRNMYEVQRQLFIFKANGQLQLIVDGEPQQVATGVRQFTHSGNFYAGTPYILYEDGRVAQLNHSNSSWTVLGGSSNMPFSAIAVGNGTLLALRPGPGTSSPPVTGEIMRWTGSAFVTTTPSPNPGKALALAEADGIAVAMYEDQTIREWNGSWQTVRLYNKTGQLVTGREFVGLAADQDRLFANDRNGDIWTIPLYRTDSRRRDWLIADRPLNTTNRVFQIAEAGGRVYARQNGVVYQFRDIADLSDNGDWRAVGGDVFSTGSSYYWDMASAGGELYVRDAFQNARVFRYTGDPFVWEDISGNYRFDDIHTSTEGNLVGTRSNNGGPIAYLGNGWEETTLLWRRGRVLTISGRNDVDDYLHLAISGDLIVATVNDPNAQQVYSFIASNSPVLKSFYFLKSQIDRVVFHGLSGNDTLELDSSWNGFVPIIAYGGEGEDNFQGRVGRDQIFGGNGRDTIAWELDFTAYLNGGAESLNVQADMVGDHILLRVKLGEAVRKAFEELHRFVVDRLRPVTEFLDSELISIKEFNFTMTWRDAISKVNGLKELVRLHDELVALSNMFSSLPVDNGYYQLGEYDVNGPNFGQIVGTSTSPFATLANNPAVVTLRSYHIDLPFLLNGRELVKAVVGLPIDLVTINTKLSDWLTPEAVEDADLIKTPYGLEPKQAISLASGFFALGPLPIQWELKFNYGFDLGIIAGLDTRGLAAGGRSRLKEGLYIQSFSLTVYGRFIAEAGWDAGLIAEKMPNLKNIEFKAPRAEIVGEIGLAQSYIYSNGNKTYLFGKNDLIPTLAVETTLFAGLRIEAELAIVAKGWTADLVDGANSVVDSGTDAFYEVYENITNTIGAITGRQVKKVRKPENEIDKEVSFTFSETLADFSRTTRSVYQI